MRGSPPRHGGRVAYHDLALLLALMLLHALPYAWGTVVLDTSRDLGEAWSIVIGAALPLLGPLINDTVHLGPLWFYLLALPLALGGSLALTLFTVGLLAALKFPLAYACGRALLDVRHGRLWAIALALPGWSTMQAVVPTHTNLIEASSLAVLLALWRLRQGAAARGWLVYGLLQSLALHAHPATLGLVLLLPWVLWQRRARLPSDLPALAGGALLALLPFVPMLWAELAAWPNALSRVAAPGTSYDSLRALAGAAALAHGWIAGGISVVVDDLLPAGARIPAIALFVLALSPLAIAVPGLRDRRALRLAFGAVLLALVWIALLRERTPFYMGYVWLPWLSALIATAGWVLLDRGRVARMLVATGVVATLLLALAAAAAQIVNAESGLGRFRPASVVDVRTPSLAAEGPLLPARRLDQWGRSVCADEGAVVLHADLALLVDAALALGARIHCGDRAQIGIGGGASVEARHVLGLMPAQRRALGFVNAGWEDTFTQAPTRVIASRSTVPPARGGLYAFRERSQGVPQPQRVAFEAPRSAFVLISTLFRSYDGARVLAVSADGLPQQPHRRSSGSTIHRCDECVGARVQWVVVIQTPEPERLDILWFDPPR